MASGARALTPGISLLAFFGGIHYARAMNPGFDEDMALFEDLGLSTQTA
ncbi:MAG: hypothetical protein OXG51_16555 [Gammaproteobacteria bacterium]|nr:hypothetical protein [Gammaproteobacteria bacterium]